MWQEIVLELQWLIGIAVSILLGFTIGFERKLRGKDAGIGTHTVVCMGSALMVVVSKYGFGSEADGARVAAQIVSGIGFLGAGIIIYRQHEIHGLTTAAGLWASAGIGMACGAGLYVVAVGSTLMMILIQVVTHLPLKVFKNKRFYRLHIVFKQNGEEALKVKEIFAVKHFHKLEMSREKGGILCSVVLFTEQEFSSERLAEIVRKNAFIVSVRREDEE